jgi:peptide/nickel transport system permease protein
MIVFLTRRSAQAVLVLLGVSLVAFLLQHLIAGGPKLAHAIIGAHATPATVNAFIHEYGLNRSLPQQYLAFVGQLVRGNLGYSFKINQSVDSIVSHDLPKDVVLVGLSIVLALLVAIPIGVMQAVKRNRPLDYAATTVAFGLYSMPAYWLGFLLIAAFSRSLHLFPPEAPQATGIGGVLSHPSGLVLPVLALALVNYALFSRYVRASAIQQLTEDYIRTARAKGASRRRILTHHLLRNSVVPVVTLLGLALPAIITNGLVVELVFNFPGLGVTFLTAAQSLDYPVVLGITVLICVFTVVGSLLADLAYAVLDPRVRYQ